MESSNAKAEVANTDKPNDKSNQPVVSPVPDLVPSVPLSSNTGVTAANASPVKASSPVINTKINTTPKKAATAALNNTSTPTAKPANPAAGVKAAHTSTSSQPATTSAPALTSTPAPTTVIAPAPAPRATSLPSAASEASVKNRSSREEKSRKKDDKSVDHVLRALNSLNTTEEKLAAMCKKYADIFDEHRKLQLLNKQTEKRCSMLQREKEQLQGEHSKAILTRSRLENLCRELQRQNKAIKDESLLKIREEEEKRKEVSAKFQTTMNEITTLMQQNNDKNMKLRDDNIDMTTKLKNICEQYEIRQQQVERISKQMQLEQQLADAKLSKLKMEMAAERETLLREKQQLLMELQQYQQRCTEFQATEVNLRNQISMYNDKYDEFQKALARSNDVFGGFKGEMEKMSKKICKLEKETSSWKQRWERSHNALLEMAADKQKSEQELAVVSRQLATLQGLCRTLQTERSTLLSKLKVLQAGSHEPVEKPADKCNKQFDQPLNHIDQPVNHLVNEPEGQPDTTGDSVLDQYTQDILASFKETVEAAEDKSSIAVPQTLNPTINQVPVQASPLPDVVGVTNPPVCVLDNKPDVNNALNQRIELISLNSNSPVIEENSNIIQPSVGNQSAIQENSVAETANQPSVIVPNPAPQVVLNGEAVTNGLPPADPKAQSPSPPQPQPPKSPTTKASPAKSTDSGKKAKESAKKKKK